MTREEKVIILTVDVEVGSVRRRSQNMVWVPGGEFLMGSEDFYPEERRSTGGVEGSGWTSTRDGGEFRRFIKATGHVTTAEISPDAADYPEATLPSWCPVRWCSPCRATGEPGRRQGVVVVGARSPVAASRGTRLHPAWPRPPSGHPRRIPRRGGVRPVGRQGAAQRGRVGVRRSGRAGGRDVRLGRGVAPPGG